MYSLVALERKLTTRGLVQESDRAVLSAHFGRPRAIDARSDIAFQQGEVRQAYLVVEGWAYSYKILPDGTRQIVEIAIPGDILGLCTLHLRQTDLLAAAVTDMVVRDFSATAFEKLVRTSATTALALMWNGALTESLVIEHLVDVGRRSAVQRAAHFMVELYERLRIVGLAGEASFRCPLTQPLIADALGLTAVHLNRTLRELRTEGWLTFHDGIVHLHDLQALVAVSGFDPCYLDSGPGIRPCETDQRLPARTEDGRGPARIDHGGVVVGLAGPSAPSDLRLSSRVRDRARRRAAAGPGPRPGRTHKGGTP